MPSKSRKTKHTKNKFDHCKGLSFSDCELAILRMAVDKSEQKLGTKIINSEEVQQMIEIVENFIKRKSLICYGGTAINNILPVTDQFYKRDIELPDYDFFSKNALNDAKELADIYYKKGFTLVEAKSGQHYGTYKVFVNYMPIADITSLHRGIYDALKKDTISIGNILYTPPNFLRMSMYLELSRPDGDTSRWEKVLKRLTLLNKNYPLTKVDCNKVIFQRDMEKKDNEDEIYNTIRTTLINQGVVFFGGYAISLYSQYMNPSDKTKLEKIADFDVLSTDPETTALILKERLKDININNVKVIKREPVGEIIPVHYEIIVGDDTVAFIYKPVACHNYNVININNQEVKIATIDTMLSFYFAFLYTDRDYYNDFLERTQCIAKLLFDVQEKNKLEQTGLLKRFSIDCYGHQETVEEMRMEKSKMFDELKEAKNSRKYEEWFLNYVPGKTTNKPADKHNNFTKNKSNNPNKRYTRNNPNKRYTRNTKNTKKMKYNAHGLKHFHHSNYFNPFPNKYYNKYNKTRKNKQKRVF